MALTIVSHTLTNSLLNSRIYTVKNWRYSFEFDRFDNGPVSKASVRKLKISSQSQLATNNNNNNSSDSWNSNKNVVGDAMPKMKCVYISHHIASHRINAMATAWVLLLLLAVDDWYLMCDTMTHLSHHIMDIDRSIDWERFKRFTTST